MLIKLIEDSGNATGSSISLKQGEFYFIISGVFDGATVTLQCKPWGSSASFADVHYSDGTAVAVTSAISDLLIYLGEGFNIRVVVSGGGGSVDITAEAMMKPRVI